MPDFLTTSLSGSQTNPPALIVWHIGTALILGLAVAGLYRWARRGETVQATFVTTLVLLAAVIAMATQVIGDNVARAFSMVGALSVVRFRTVVKDTQDTAFVIFAVVVGMAAGANHLMVALVGLMVVGVASIGPWPPRRPGAWERSTSTLSLRIGLAEGVRTAAEGLLARAVEQLELTSAATAKQCAALNLTYRVHLRPECSPASLVAELNRLEGVESVERVRVPGDVLSTFSLREGPALNNSFRQFHVVAMAGVFALLLGGDGAAFAQQAAEQRTGGHFVTIGSFHINLDQVQFVTHEKSTDGKTQVEIHFVGVHDRMVLSENDADAIMAAFAGKPAGDQAVGRKAKLEAEAPSEGLVLLAYDEFDGKLGLKWKPVRPAPSHVSLKKAPGALTITTQRGSIHGEET